MKSLQYYYCIFKIYWLLIEFKESSFSGDAGLESVLEKVSYAFDFRLDYVNAWGAGWNGVYFIYEIRLKHQESGFKSCHTVQTYFSVIWGTVCIGCFVLWLRNETFDGRDFPE